MKAFLTIVLLWSNLSMAELECNFLSLSKDQKAKLFQKLKGSIYFNLSKFFKDNDIEIKKERFEIGINTEYVPTYPDHLRTRVDVFFMGETMDGEFISTRPSEGSFSREFYEGGIYPWFSAIEVKNSKGRNKKTACLIRTGGPTIRIFNLNNQSRTIGEIQMEPEILGVFLIP
jgi:hypothetical protein